MNFEARRRMLSDTYVAIASQSRDTYDDNDYPVFVRIASLMDEALRLADETFGTWQEAEQAACVIGFHAAIQSGCATVQEASLVSQDLSLILKRIIGIKGQTEEDRVASIERCPIAKWCFNFIAHHAANHNPNH